MKIKIKVCGMKNPDNMKSISELDIHYMGFIFYAPSPRYVGSTLINDNLQNKTITGVGVFVNEKRTTVQTLLQNNQLTHVQLHGEESPGYCQQIKDAGFTVIKAFRVGEDFDFRIVERYIDTCDYFLFDTKGKTHGGTGHKFNWQILQQYTYNKPFFLSGGIGAEDVEAIQTFNHPMLHALDLNSRFEIAAGEKNVEALGHFIESIN